MSIEKDPAGPGLIRRVVTPVATMFDDGATQSARRLAAAQSIVGGAVVTTGATVGVFELARIAGDHAAAIHAVVHSPDTLAAGAGLGIAAYALITTASAARLDRDPVKTAFIGKMCRGTRNAALGGVGLTVLASAQALVVNAPSFLREDLAMMSFFGGLAGGAAIATRIVNERRPRPAPSLGE